MLGSRIVTWQGSPKLYCSFMTGPCSARWPTVFVFLISVQRCQSVHGRDWQKLVQVEVQALVREEQTKKAVAIQQHRAWFKWDQELEWGVIWKYIWHWNSQRIKFFIQGVFMPIQPAHMSQERNISMLLVFLSRTSKRRPKNCFSGLLSTARDWVISGSEKFLHPLPTSGWGLTSSWAQRQQNILSYCS